MGEKTMNGHKAEIEKDVESSVLTMVTNEFFDTLEKDQIGWPIYCTVTREGQLRIWPSLDTSQIQIEVHLC